MRPGPPPINGIVPERGADFDASLSSEQDAVAGLARHGVELELDWPDLLASNRAEPKDDAEVLAEIDGRPLATAAAA